jgi:hypothetical protein
MLSIKASSNWGDNISAVTVNLYLLTLSTKVSSNWGDNISVVKVNLYLLTLSIKASSNWGDNISVATVNPMMRNTVYMQRVPVDSLICGRNRQHRPQEAGPHQHLICKKNKGMIGIWGWGSRQL